MSSEADEEFIEKLRKELDPEVIKEANERNKYEKKIEEERVKTKPVEVLSKPEEIIVTRPKSVIPEQIPVDIPAQDEVIVPKRYKLIGILLFVGLGALVYYFASSFYYFFGMFLYFSIELFKAGDVGLGVACLIIQILAWIVAFFLFYVGFFNIVFPRIRAVNAMRTHNTIARKVIRVIGPDPNFIYLKIKFKLFPIFDWYTMKIPKGMKWTRMPSSLDVHSDNIDLHWKDGMYMMTSKPLNRIPDEIKTYRSKAQKTLRLIGEEVGLSISGDSDMMKDYYSLNLVLDEENELVPAKSLKKPPSELEKEVKDE